MSSVKRRFRASVLLLAIVGVLSLIAACMSHTPASPEPDPTHSPAPVVPATTIGALTPRPVPTSTPTPTAITLESEVERIKAQVSGVRGLALEQDPPTLFISAEQMAENIREAIKDDYTREEANIDAELFILLDFIPPGTDLKKVFSELYAGSVVGYYDTDTGEMYVLNEGDDLTPAAKHALAHELIHALQDQVFDLDAFLPEDEENDDLARAKTALIEGDAVIAALRYATSFLTRSEIVQIYRSGGDRPDISKIPPVLIELITFPYREGAAFVDSIHTGSDWEAVDAAYSDPPLSTEHILHPDKYLAGELPETVRLPDFSSVPGPGWETLDEGVLGEYLIRLYLENRLTRSRAANAAEFWGGDAYALLRNEAGDESALVSLSAWDSGEDAQDFFSAVTSYFETPGQGDWQPGITADDIRSWDSGERVVQVALRDDEVLLIISESASALIALAARFPEFPSGP